MGSWRATEMLHCTLLYVAVIHSFLIGEYIDLKNMFIRVSVPLYDLNETRIHVNVSRQQLCRACTFLVGNPIGEREFWIFSCT